MPVSGPLSVELEQRLRAVGQAARSSEPIAGYTHTFYRYPARFSPSFVRGAIQAFSRPGDLVLDPFMGGGTTVVEAMLLGRRAVGCDLNSLGVFVARVKLQPLLPHEGEAIRNWVDLIVTTFSYRESSTSADQLVCPRRTRNLSLPRARPIKKLLAFALSQLAELPSARARAFARCLLLNVSQWALNGRRSAVSLKLFRYRLLETAETMLAGLSEFREAIDASRYPTHAPILIHGDSSELAAHPLLDGSRDVSLVVTSPPYPGIHVLYHRWQVDGRRETPAPYWIADCLDGRGDAFYNFADRRLPTTDNYFDASLRALKAIRRVMRPRGVVVQLVAFSDPTNQLPRYLTTMEEAGFVELVRRTHDGRPVRVWRSVPGRRWHADQKGETNSSREVLLVHRAL